MRRFTRDRRGSAFIAVAIFGALTSLVIVTFVGRTVVEYRNIEASLAQVRTYWAAIGQLNYTLSRTVQSGSSSNNGYFQNGFATQTAVYLQELAGSSSNGAMTWQYPDVSANYAFVSTPVVSIPANALSGELVINFTFAPASTATAPEVLAKLPAMGSLQVGYCIVPALTHPCGYSLRKQDTFYDQVTSVHRGS